MSYCCMRRSIRANLDGAAKRRLEWMDSSGVWSTPPIDVLVESFKPKHDAQCFAFNVGSSLVGGGLARVVGDG